MYIFKYRGIIGVLKLFVHVLTFKKQFGLVGHLSLYKLLYLVKVTCTSTMNNISGLETFYLHITHITLYPIDDNMFYHIVDIIAYNS